MMTRPHRIDDGGGSEPIEVEPPPRPRYTTAEIRATVAAALRKSEELKEALRELNEAIGAIGMIGEGAQDDRSG